MQPTNLIDSYTLANARLTWRNGEATGKAHLR